MRVAPFVALSRSSDEEDGRPVTPKWSPQLVAIGIGVQLENKLASDAGYYSDAEQMTLKVLFDPATGQILGAQGIGKTGVDKRVDVLATAIQARTTVYDLENAELSRASQFGSAKDPINTGGFVAAGLLRNDHPQIDVETLLSISKVEQPFLLDVRTAREFASGNIPNSVNIPVDEVRSRLNELPTDRKLAAYCKVGQRGYIATRILFQHGFGVVNLSGGYTTYRHFMA